MYDLLVQLLTQNSIFAFIFIVAIIIFAVLLAITQIRSVGMESIRYYVYELFIKAEYSFEHGENEQKFEYVVQLARSNLPAPFNMFITEKFLRKMIQLWFELVKDLIDSGKINDIINRDK